MKKTLNILKKVISYVLVAVALFAVVFTIISVTTVNNSKRSLLGYKFFVVLSDSMSATDFSAGDMIVVKEVDVNTLEKDDIITFYSTDPKSLGEIITHKIREVKKNENGKLIGFETFGTTTGSSDETLAEPTNIIGQYQFSIPSMGYFIQFMKTPVAYIIFVAVPFALIIGSEVYKCFKIINENKKEKLRVETEEREKLLEEERLKNEQMLKEIEELKRRLASEKKDSEE